VKIPDRIELIARVRAHSRSFLAQLERDEAYRTLEALKRELEEKNLELARLSLQDGLTGLANRRRLDEALDREIRRAHRDGSPLSVLLTDVDFFKKYNDTYGHQAGDDCLRRVAATLARCARRPADLAARYGGEEFCVVLPDTPEEGACKVAEDIRSAVCALGIEHRRSDAAEVVTLSLGVITLEPGQEITPAKLIEGADAALYAAKRAGRNCWVAASTLPPSGAPAS
jgi:two-component system chemotaxis family response regulator WspR